MIRLAVPNNKNFDFLTDFTNEALEKYKIQVLKLSEEQCFDNLLNNRADAALLSPLSYGKGMRTADFRIINAPLLATENYTSLAYIYFKQNLATILSCASPSPEDFIIKTGQILLSEKFEIDVPFIAHTKELSGENHPDAVIAWNNADNPDTTLDISEEWYDSYELPLPLAFWVCRSEEYHPEIEFILRQIEMQSTEDQYIADKNEYPEMEARSGRLIFTLTQEVEEGLDQVLQLLYFRGIFPEVPGIKILGREDDAEIE